MKYQFTNTNTDNIDPGKGKFVFSKTIGFKLGEIVTLSRGGVFKITRVLSCGNHFKTKNMNKRQLKKFNKNHNGCYKLFLEEAILRTKMKCEIEIDGIPEGWEVKNVSLRFHPDQYAEIIGAVKSTDPVINQIKKMPKYMQRFFTKKKPRMAAD